MTDSALKLVDVLDVEEIWMSNLCTSSSFHVSRDLPPNAIATKKDLFGLVKRISSQARILLSRQPELKENQL